MHLYITMSMYEFIFIYHITTFVTIIEYTTIKYVFDRLDYLIGREKLTYFVIFPRPCGQQMGGGMRQRIFGVLDLIFK